MRRSAAIAILMGSTVLMPAQAEAGPLAALVIAVAASSAGAFAASAITGAVLSAAVGALVTVGVSYVGQMLLGQNKQKQNRQAIAPSTRFANFAQPVSYAEWVFGRTRKGGPLAFTGFKVGPDFEGGPETARRHYAVILAAHRVKGVVTHYFDERQVTVDGGGNVQEEPIATEGNIRFYRGAAGQSADPTLMAAFPEWTSAHDMTGLAYGAIWALRPDASQSFSEIYPTGRQWAYLPVIDGWDEIYDPRDDTTKWTDNAALVTAHVITQIFGQTVNGPAVAVEANAADAAGWKCNGVLSADQSYEDMRAALMIACDGHWFERPDGGVGFYVGRWIAPSITLTARDFYAVEISEGTRDGNAPTEVASQYSEPANAYREAISGAIVFEGGGTPRREELTLQLVSSHLQASKINKRRGLAMRARYRLQGTIGLVGYELWAGRDGGLPERFFRLQHAGLDQYFEIDRLEKVGLAQFRIEARSVAATDFDFAPAEEPPRPIRGTVASDDTVPVISGVAATAIDNGAVEVNWNDQPSYLGQQVRIREQGATDWTINDVPAGQTFLPIRGLATTTATPTYEAQARNRTRGFRTSEWKPDTPVTVVAVANSTPPMALTAFSSSAVGSDITITLTPDGSDPNYYATRIYRADYATGYAGAFDFADASLVRTENGIPSEADQWADTGLAAGVYAYWGEPINISGVTDAGLRSGPTDAEIT